jgi:alcohol dehydrogenase
MMLVRASPAWSHAHRIHETEDIMRQLTVNETRSLHWSDVPAPRLSSPQSAVVRPIAVATCDFDHLLLAGHVSAQLPLAIGHEFVAEVIEVGSAVSSFRPGDTVVVPFQIHCGQCPTCLRHETSSCERLPFLSCYGLGAMAGGWGGAVSDRVGVPFADAMLVRLPAGVAPADAAACSCNVTDAYRCVGPQLLARPGAAVLVVGGAFGNIALYAVAIARALGAARVDLIDADPRRAAIARRLGANVLEASATPLSAYPITVDASMDPALLSLALRATAPAGECTVSTMYAGGPTAIPLFEMFQNCVTLRTGQPHVRAHLDAVLKLLAEGRLDLRALTEAVVDWEEAPRAFAHGHGKIVCVR